MSRVKSVLEHLRNVKKNGVGFMATCPAHDDDTPSLHITEGRDGRVLVKCFAGCPTSDILAAAGLTLSELFDEHANGNGKAHIVATYRYVDETGTHLYDVVRFEPKDFRQRDASGKWKMEHVRRVPYRLPQLLAGIAAHRHVLIVEGEKDVDALVGLGFVATTNSGGAEKWRSEYNALFQNAHAVILPDNDDPGRKHAHDVARHLLGVAADVRIVELPNLPPKGDVSDWLSAGGTADGLKALVRAAPVLTSAPTAVKVQHEPDAEDDFDLGLLRATPHLDDAALHGDLGAIVRLVAPYTEAHPAGILFGLLAGFGAMLGRSPFCVLSGVEHRVNLFVMLVGASSDGRKGTAQAAARSLLRRIDPAFTKGNIDGGLSSGEGLIYRLADDPPQKDGIRLVVVKDKRLLIAESEMASAFKRMARDGNTLSIVLRQAWDGDTLATMTKGSTAADAGGLRANEHHVAVVAQINQAELQRYLGDVELVNGFANRFLFCHVERARLCPDDERPDERELDPHVKALAKRLDQEPRELRLSKDAGDLWRGETYAELSAGAPGRMGPLTARAGPIVRRLGMIYALVDGAEHVDVIHLRAARAVWQYSRDSVRYIYGETVFSPVALKMLHAITACSADGIDLTDLRAASATKNLSAVDRRRALDELLMAGVVKPETEETPGRSRTRLRLTRFALPTGSGRQALRALRAISDDAGDLNAPNALNALLPTAPIPDDRRLI